MANLNTTIGHNLAVGTSSFVFDVDGACATNLLYTASTGRITSAARTLTISISFSDYTRLRRDAAGWTTSVQEILPCPNTAVTVTSLCRIRHSHTGQKPVHMHAEYGTWEYDIEWRPGDDVVLLLPRPAMDLSWTAYMNVWRYWHDLFSQGVSRAKSLGV